MSAMNLGNLIRWLVGLLSVAGRLALVAVAAEAPAGRDLFVVPGHVQHAWTVYVTASVPGTITKLHADIGDAIKAGDVVAELDASRYQLELERAQASVEVARARSQELKAGLREEDRNQSPAKERLATAEAEVKQAEAGLRLAKYNLDATQIRAPGAGIVLARRAHVGQTTSPGQSDGASGSLFELADLQVLSVTTQIAEADAGKVFRGQRCQVEVAALPKTVYEGKVVRLRPVVDPSTGTFPVDVEIQPPQKDRRLVPGMFVVVTFLAKE